MLSVFVAYYRNFYEKKFQYVSISLVKKKTDIEREKESRRDMPGVHASAPRQYKILHLAVIQS